MLNVVFFILCFVLMCFVSSEERKIHDLSLQRPTLHLIQHFFFTFVHLSYIGIVLMFYLLPEMKAPGSYVIIVQRCADVMLQFPALYPGCFKA